MKELDLHGTKHFQIEKKLDSFFVNACPPLVIITGQSQRMKDLVSQIANRYGLKAKASLSNPGRLVIYE